MSCRHLTIHNTVFNGINGERIVVSTGVCSLKTRDYATKEFVYLKLLALGVEDSALTDKCPFFGYYPDSWCPFARE